MPRPFFGSGFFPAPNEAPEDYTDQLAWFGGDEGTLSAWVQGWIAYSTSGEAQEILDAAQAVGDPADALATLRAAPVQRAGDFVAELDTPADLAFAAPAVPLDGMPGRATDLA